MLAASEARVAGTRNAVFTRASLGLILNFEASVPRVHQSAATTSARGMELVPQ